MKIALIDRDHHQLNQYLSLVIEAHSSFYALEFESIAELQNALKQHVDIGMIFYHDPFDNLDALKMLEQILIQYSHIVLGVLSVEDVEKNTALKEFFIRNKQAQFLALPFNNEEIEQFFKELIKLKQDLDKDLGVIDTDNFNYKKVKLLHFTQVDENYFDVYLKLSSSNFIKIIKKDDPYAEETLNKFAKKGVEYLYLETKDYEKFTKAFHEKLIKLINTPKVNANSSSTKSVSEQMLAIHNVSDQLKAIGFNESSILMVDQVMKSTLVLLQNNKDLFKVIENSLHRKDYLAEHSLLIAAISITVAKKTGWAATGNNEKLAMASLLHDSLFMDERLAKAQTLDSIKYNRKELKEIKNHPIKTSLYLEQMKFDYPDLDTIILQHHERPDGTGFPRGLTSANIAPMSALFIMTEDMVHELFEKGFSAETIKEILKRFDVVYTSGSFKGALDSFHKTFIV